MTKLSEPAIEFLRSVMRHGGEAQTSQIRVDAGLSRGQVDYYYDRLDDLGYITVEKADVAQNGGFPPRIAVLTDEAEQQIRKGNLGGDLLDDHEDKDSQTVSITKNQFEKFRERLDSQESRLDTLAAEGIGESSVDLDELAGEVDELRSDVAQMNHHLVPRVLAIEHLLQIEYDDRRVEDAVKEYREWWVNDGEKPKYV